VNIQSTRSVSLPKLPQIPATGSGTIVTEPIDYVAPETVETRLGSIPRNFETGSGSRRSTRSIPFADGEKEAANRYGRSTDIWRPQPVFGDDGAVKMEDVSKGVEVKYRNAAAEGAVKGLMGAGLVGFLGLWAGTVTSILTGRPEPMIIGGVGGAAVGGLVAGVGAYKDASSERVRLEWQKTDIVEHELTGYTYRVDEDEDCTGTGDDRRCDTDYEHIHRPIIETTKHGEYFKPVVVRYKEDANS
jgi:hypothetical protein